MNLTFQASEGQPPYRIDAGALNNDLAAALGGWCNGWNTNNTCPTQAIVNIDDERNAALVRRVVEAHIAAADVREWNKAIDAQIAALEATVTQRTLREAALGATGRLKSVDGQIAALRLSRR